MLTKNRFLGPRFFRWWLFASVIAFAIEITMGGGFQQGIDINELASGLVGGTALGFFQWLVIRRFAPEIADWKWIIVGTFSWAVGFSIGFPIGESIPGHSYLAGSLGGSSGGISGGLLLGLGHWWFVLRHRIPNSSRWIVASTLGWGLGFTLCFTFLLGAALESGVSYPVSIVIAAFAGTFPGILGGGITGIMLMRLLSTIEGHEPHESISMFPKSA